VSIHCNHHRIILVCVFHPLFFTSPYLFFAVIILSSLYIFHQLCFSFAGFVHCGHYSQISCFIFQFPFEFVVFDHCGRHRIILVYFPSIVFFPLLCLFFMVVIISSLYVFDYMCFPFAVFVHCGHNSNQVDEYGFPEEIHRVYCFLLVLRVRRHPYKL
jgi:hypothetical protein